MAPLILATAAGAPALALRPMNSLGRHPNNTIQLLDKIVSKEHCLIEQRGNDFVLRDLGSLNGTYINGERVRGEGLLRHGDEIALGATRARFDDGSGLPMAQAYLPPSPGWQAQPPGPPPPARPPGQGSAGPPIPPTAAHPMHSGGGFSDPTAIAPGYEPNTGQYSPPRPGA